MRWIPVSAVLAALLFSCLCGPAAADDVKQAYKDYQRLWAQGSKKAACEALAKANTAKVAKQLVQLILKHLEIPRNEKPAEADARVAVIEGCINGLARMGNPEGHKLVDGIVKNRRYKAGHKKPFIVCLGRMTNNPKAAKTLIEIHAKAKDPDTQVEISTAMEQLNSEQLIDTWQKDLKSELWMVVAAASRGLARHMGKAKQAVPALIAQMGTKDVKIHHAVRQALVGMTGEGFNDKQDWDVWWKKHKDQPLKGKGLGSKPNVKSGSVEIKQPTYYGVKFVASKVAFCIDISGSMGEMVRGNLKQPPASTGDKRPASMRYDWTKIRNRMDLAKAHLVYTLAHLDKRTYFNIFIYSGNSKPWQPKPVLATKDNKIKAIERVKKLTAGGGTNIYESLQQAFEYPGGTMAKKIKDGYDTIFVMTDGLPTSGTLTTASHTDYRERFGKVVEDWGKNRKVKVHTVGIGKGHDGALLQKIALASGGTYTTAGD